MRAIFKNANIFGFTGTPLTKPERNTFQRFSPAGELYLHRYGMLDSIEDGFTIPIRYDARLPELHLKEKEIEELAEYEDEVIEELTPRERRVWRKKVKPKLAILKSPERIEKVCSDILSYFKTKVEKTNLKVMIATVDRESCVLFKKEIDKELGPKSSDIVMTYQAREKSRQIEEYKKELVSRFGHSDFDKMNEDIVYKFRTEELPKILIVSDMLLTGFDAKNLWTLFLYKALKEHRLLQAIARTNRPYKGVKEFGLVVDYIGLAKDLERALQQFETEFINEAKLIIRDLSSSEKEFEKCVDELKGMLGDVAIGDIENVDEAVELLVQSSKEKEFEQSAKKLRILYELISPSDVTFKHLEFYKWVICISIALHRYRNIGMNLAEIEVMARKTYELVQKTVGVKKIEKIGEVDIVKELSKLETNKKPRDAIKVLGGIGREISTRRSDFYVSLRSDIENVINEMRKQKEVTKQVIDEIRSMYKRLEQREVERERLKEIFPIFDVLRAYFEDATRVESVSRAIVKELRERDLLGKESFLKGSLRKQVRRTVREGIIRSFGLTDKMDEIEDRVFANLEEEHA